MRGPHHTAPIFENAEERERIRQRLVDVLQREFDAGKDVGFAANDEIPSLIASLKVTNEMGVYAAFLQLRELLS